MSDGAPELAKRTAPAAATCLILGLLLVGQTGRAEEPPPSLQPPRIAPPTFRLEFGPTTGTRAMTFEGTLRTVEHRPFAFTGVDASATATLATLSSIDGFLVAELDGGYAVTAARLEPDGPQLRSEYSTLGLRSWIVRRTGETTAVGLGPGFRASSVVLQPNPTYTGHRYLAASVGLRTRWRPAGGRLTLGLEVDALPVVATDVSDGGHGPARAFGVRATPSADWRIAPASRNDLLRRLHFALDYRYERFRTQLPEAPLGTHGGVSADNLHFVTLALVWSRRR